METSKAQSSSLGIVTEGDVTNLKPTVASEGGYERIA